MSQSLKQPFFSKIVFLCSDENFIIGFERTFTSSPNIDGNFVRNGNSTSNMSILFWSVADSLHSHNTNEIVESSFKTYGLDPELCIGRLLFSDIDILRATVKAIPLDTLSYKMVILAISPTMILRWEVQIVVPTTKLTSSHFSIQIGRNIANIRTYQMNVTATIESPLNNEVLDMKLDGRGNFSITCEKSAGVTVRTEQLRRYRNFIHPEYNNRYSGKSAMINDQSVGESKFDPIQAEFITINSTDYIFIAYEVGDIICVELSSMTILFQSSKVHEDFGGFTSWILLYTSVSHQNILRLTFSSGTRDENIYLMEAFYAIPDTQSALNPGLVNIRERGCLDLTKECRYCCFESHSNLDCQKQSTKSNLPLKLAHLRGNSRADATDEGHIEGAIIVVTTSHIIIINADAFKIMSKICLDNVGISHPQSIVICEQSRSLHQHHRDASNAVGMMNHLTIKDCEDDSDLWDGQLDSDSESSTYSSRHLKQSLSAIIGCSISFQPEIKLIPITTSMSNDVCTSVEANKLNLASIYADPMIPLSLFQNTDWGKIKGNEDADSDQHGSVTAGMKSNMTCPLDNDIKSDTPRLKRSLSANNGSTDNQKGKSLKDKTGSNMNQPILFHNKVKSSGYGNQPKEKKIILQKQKQKRDELSQRSFNRRGFDSLKSTWSAAPSERAQSSPNPNATSVGVRLRMYPMDCQIPTQVQNYNIIQNNTNPIQYLTFSEDAAYLGVVTTENIVTTYRLPTGRNNFVGPNYMGHNGRITRLSFAHHKRHILSSSSDGTARLWSIGKADAADLIISHSHKNVNQILNDVNTNMNLRLPSNAPAKSRSRNRPFGHELSNALFYYQDKFINITVKSSIMMYGYDLDDAQSKKLKDSSANLKRSNSLSTKPYKNGMGLEDMKYAHTSGRYQRVAYWDLDAQNITSLACINSILSPLLFCGTSDRRLHVLDASIGSNCIVRSVDDAHNRPINHIALPQPSVHVGASPDQYNIFATAAADNVLAIWDLRSPRVAARFTDHVNRRERINCALSPCLKFIAVGSEDKSCRIIDTYAGKELTKLSGFHKDVVTSVAFNPLFPQLASASIDGSVVFYIDPTTASISSNGII